MTRPTDPDAAPPLGLRMPKAMSVPGICRGALTQWPQLHAAIHELSLDPASRPAFVGGPGATQAQRVGGPVQLQAALASDAGYLSRPTPPPDLYAWFVWLTLRVYQGARRFNLTLQHLPDLFQAAPGTTQADRGEWVKEVLAGTAGLLACAQGISLQASTFARHLHGIESDLGAARAAHQQAAEVFSQPSPVGDNQQPASINAHGLARQLAQQTQYQLAHLQLSAARVTALSVLDNMTKATDTLVESWQRMVLQLETIAARPVAELGNLELLRNTFYLDEATPEWGAFAGVIQAFVQGTLLTVRAR
ncbi:MAG: hypothetical protein ABWY06_03965 [Pseudomonas sp.]|uniref:hypothetical protein n=1 Tax=Pseudomonas sp. TaxID=306 RepID=UPI00339B328D